MSNNGNKRPENEAAFRAANENLRANLVSLEGLGNVPFICECSDGECMEVVDVPLATYQAVRAGRNDFLLRVGHETPTDERVVARHDGYVVVEKRQPVAGFRDGDPAEP
jgi:hypothetical protein